jgi:hypothetical protein
LAHGQPLISDPAVELPDHHRLCLIDDQTAWPAIAARLVAVAVGCLGTDDLPFPGPLQLATPKPLSQHGALVLGDGALDLQQQLVVRVVGDRVVQEHHRAAGTPKFLEQQHLVCVFAGQAVGGEHSDDLDSPIADSVAQGIQARTIEPCAAIPLVAEDVLGGEIVALLDDPGTQGSELAFDGLLTLLAFGGHPSVDGGTHGSPPWLFVGDVAQWTSQWRLAAVDG